MRKIIFCLMVLGFLTGSAGSSQPVFGQTIVLDHEEIGQAMLEGMQFRARGVHDVWAWTLDTQPLIIEINGTRLFIKPNKKAQANRYSWKRVGDISFRRRSSKTLRIYSHEDSKFLPEKSIAYLAFVPKGQPSLEHKFALSRVYPHSIQTSTDKRLGIVRSKDDYYAFPHYAFKRDWLERKQYLKEHFLMSMGCYPLPPKTALNAHLFDRMEFEDYTIEKVYFESLPGFFVTGNLYRPKGKRGPFPAILCPHGHWNEGRLTNTDNNSIPGRCINFAKQGYIAFAIDMIGYVDSKQLTHDFGGPREWLWGLSLHGLQFWNSVRSIDFLESLDDVDADRIGCTGASGGGTQTYGLMAMDDRIRYAAPVNMLSSHFQGGCLCENAANLRIDLNNVELGAMFAPRPLMMVSCTGDWTQETPWVEYPAIRSVYALYGQPDHVGMIQIDAGHNYNRLSREAVYAWFGKWVLRNNNAEDFKEQPFDVDPEALRVFPGDLPEQAISRESLISNWQSMAEEQLHSLYPDSKRKLEALRRRYRTALQHALGASIPHVNELSIHRTDAGRQGKLYVEKMILGRKGAGDEIPVIVLIPNERSGTGTLLVHSQGKDRWFDENGKPGVLVQSLLEQGQTVVLADPFLTGEFHSPFQKAVRDRNLPHFLTYNPSDTALQVQDILTSLVYLQSRYEVEQVNLIGGQEAGLWCLLAASLTESLDHVVIDAAGFASDDDASFMHRLYVPGLRRAGDIRVAQALLAPTPLLIHNTQALFDCGWAKSAYQTASLPSNLRLSDIQLSEASLAQWLKNTKD